MGNLTMNGNAPMNIGASEVEARQLAEIRGKMVLARQFPRDPEQSLKRILIECENPKLAEVAVYSYPRGGQEVKGPSIRLAEVIASHWGNFLCGVTELEQRRGESTVKAFAWDLESNYSDEKVFTAQHVRATKKGSYSLTDPRDIYELVANQGARRKRACIFSVIPAYLVDAAVERCQEVLEKDIAKGDIEKTREKMLQSFMQMDEIITQEALEAKVGKPFDKFGARDIAKLKNLYAAIRDGYIKPAAAFDLGVDPDAPEIDAEDAEKLEEIQKSMASGNPFETEDEGPDETEEAGEADATTNE